MADLSLGCHIDGDPASTSLAAKMAPECDDCFGPGPFFAVPLSWIWMTEGDDIERPAGNVCAACKTRREDG